MEAEVVKSKMTKDVIEKIIEIDKHFYHKNYEKEWYFTRYNDKNEIFLLKANGQIVGYANIISISKKLFDDILNFKYEDDYSFPETEVNVRSNYFYLPSILVLNEFRQFSVPLIKRIATEIESLKNFVAITVSREGETLARLILKPKTNSKIKVFFKEEK